MDDHIDLSLEKWIKIHEKIYHLNSNNERETIPYLQDTLFLMRELNSSPERAREILSSNPEFHRYFTDKFYQNSAKNILLTRTFHLDEVLNLANKILEEQIIFFANTIEEGNVKIAEIFKLIMDPSKQYFKYNDQFRNDYNYSPVLILLPCLCLHFSPE